MRRLVGLAAVLLVGCVVDTTRPAGVPLLCASSAPRCPPGLTCNTVSGACEATLDGGPTSDGGAVDGGVLDAGAPDAGNTDAGPGQTASFTAVRLTPLRPAPGDTLVAWPVGLREPPTGPVDLRITFRDADGGVIASGSANTLDLSGAGLGAGASVTAEIASGPADGGVLHASCQRSVGARSPGWFADRPSRFTQPGPDEPNPRAILEPAQHRLLLVVERQLWEFDLERVRSTRTLGAPPQRESLRWRQLAPEDTPPESGTPVAFLPDDALVAFSTSLISLSLERGCESWYMDTILGTPPPVREGATRTTDTDLGNVIVFGGFESAAASAELATLDTTGGGTPLWTRPTASGSPTARGGHVTAFDSLNNTLIVLGGATCAADCGSKTLVASNAPQRLTLGATMAWSDFTPSGTPPAFYRATAAFDSTRGQVLVWGGCADVTCAQYRPELWSLSGPAGSESWAVINRAGAPPAGPARAFYDEAEDALVVLVKPLGGSYRVYALAPPTATATWVELDPHPGPRALHGAAYLDNRLVLYGGDAATGAASTEVWTWDGVRWDPSVVTGGPGPLRGMGLGIESSAALLLHAGDHNFVENGDLWRLSLAPLGWEKLAVPSPPNARAYHRPAFVPARSDGGTQPVLRFFGGIGDSAVAIGDGADLVLADGGLAWSPHGGSLPTARAHHTTVYDPGSDRFVLIGGEDPGDSPLLEIWTSPASSSAEWTQEGSISPALPHLADAAAVSIGPGRIAVYGGVGRQGTAIVLCRQPGPSWAWRDFTSQEDIAPCGGEGPTAHYDAATDTLYVYGGGADRYCDAIWAYRNVSTVPCP